MSGKRPKIYFIAPNGVKIELNGFGPVSFYAREQVRSELVEAFRVPKDMVFPDKKLVGVTLCEPRLNVALTDELRSKGSVEVKFDFPKE